MGIFRRADSPYWWYRIWTHFLFLIPIKDQLKRDFYVELCRVERWHYATI